MALHEVVGKFKPIPSFDRYVRHGLQKLAPDGCRTIS